MGNWTERDISDQSGKTFVITGGNSGIGWEAGRMLAEHGAHVILACRNADKAKDAVASIEKTAVKGAKVEAMSLDLASLSSVERFAGELAGKIERLDALLNNAGLMALPYGKTADGFETQLGVNHLGHFALTGRLLPLLRKTPGARVVSVSSQAHRMGKMNWDDLMSERRYEKWTAYGQSKLANLLFTFELGRRLKKAGDGIVVTAAHPGYSATNLQHKGPEMEGSKLQGMFMSMGNGIMAQTAANGRPAHAARSARSRGGERRLLRPERDLRDRGIPREGGHQRAGARRSVGQAALGALGRADARGLRGALRSPNARC
jgi:NAD(P)-dependent dehydrogenase (short-subunit alcohol dehydrogenase family)